MINLTIRKHLFKKKQNKTKKNYGSSLEHHGKSNYMDQQKMLLWKNLVLQKLGNGHIKGTIEYCFEKTKYSKIPLLRSPLSLPKSRLIEVVLLLTIIASEKYHLGLAKRGLNSEV